MAITNITSLTINGVSEVTTTNVLSSNGGASDESILMYGAAAAIRAGGVTDILFERCNFYILSDVGATSNPSASVLSYNGDNSNRKDTDSFIRFVDTNIIFDSSGRKNLFISELTKSKVIHQDSANGLYIYTPPNAILEDVLFQGTQTWEVVGVPTIASNIRMVDVTYGFLNWEAGRLDFLNLNVESSLTADAWLGNGNSGNNSAYLWNSKSFDNTKIRFQNLNGEYYEGNTASYVFIDRDTSLAVQDVLVKYDSDISGLRLEKGRYVTDSSGITVGDYDSKNDSTGSSQQRPTLYFINNYADLAGTTYSANGYDYDIVSVSNYLEVRSYLHERPVGFSNSDTYTITSEIGSINADYTLNVSQNFILAKDSSITETDKAVVDGYLIISNDEELYDVHKSKWRDNDNYPYLIKINNLIDFGSYDVVIDALASDIYDFTGNTITIKASSLTCDLLTTGTITLQNGASINGTYTDASGTTTTIQYTLTFTNLKPNSEIRIYDAETFQEIAGVENSTDTFQYTYDHLLSGSRLVHYVIHSLQYQIEKQDNFVLINNDFSIEVNQELDRSYKNP